MKRRKNNANVIGTSVSPKNQNISGIAGISLIVFLLDKLSDAIYNALVNGFFGYIFTSYTSELSAFERGYVCSFFKGGGKIGRLVRNTRKYLSENFETSFILRWTRKGIRHLVDIPIKSYGRFFLSFGIYTLLIYFIKLLFPNAGGTNSDYFFVGLCICIVTLPLHFSRCTLAGAVKRSRITGAIFIEAFGYRNEAFINKGQKKAAHAGPSILSGLIFGMLTFVFHPLDLLLFLLAFAIVALIMITPEIGILICLFFLPLLSFASNPAIILAILVTVTAFSYIIKLVRGKRIIKFKLIDISVLTFLVMIYFSGLITVGGKASFYSAIISCCLMLGYFLIVNLMRTEKWIYRCVLALVSSGTIVAVVGVLQYVLGFAVNQWIDTDYFTNINGRATALFDNPNYLAAYLALVFPFALFLTCTRKNKKERFLCLICCAVIALATVFTWCRASWIAMIACSIIFLIIYSKKTIRYVLCSIFVIPFAPFVLPENIVSRFLSIGDMADSSTLYRVYTWKGSLSMLKDYFLGGIGYGVEAFQQIYPIYAYAGIETAVHSHNLYLQILIGLGVAGLLCFAITILLYVQNSFEYMKKPITRESGLIVAASLTAIFSILIMGAFDYVWYNYRIFYIFWSILALGIACIRIGNKEILRSSERTEFDDCTSSVDMILQ